VALNNEAEVEEESRAEFSSRIYSIAYNIIGLYFHLKSYANFTKNSSIVKLNKTIDQHIMFHNKS
jgi:hypothetical protein